MQPDSARPGLPPWLGRSQKASALDRAPALVAALAGAAEAWAADFAEVSGTPVEMRCEGLRLAAVADVVRDRGGAPCCAVLRVPDWNAEMGIACDPGLVAALVEALFGGAGEDGDLSPSTTLSPIEVQIVELFGRQVAAALETGLGPEVRLAAQFDRLLVKPDFGTLGKGEQPVGVVSFAITVLGGGGGFDLLVPVSLLESLIDGLADDEVEQPAEHDPRWSRLLGDEVGRALTPLRAVVDLAPMSLGAILGLMPGQVLSLPPAAGSKVRLTCGAADLFRCDLGQLGGQYTVRIEDVLAGAVDSDHSLPQSLA